MAHRGLRWWWRGLISAFAAPLPSAFWSSTTRLAVFPWACGPSGCPPAFRLSSTDVPSALASGKGGGGGAAWDRAEDLDRGPEAEVVPERDVEPGVPPAAVPESLVAVLRADVRQPPPEGALGGLRQAAPRPARHRRGGARAAGGAAGVEHRLAPARTGARARPGAGAGGRRSRIRGLRQRPGAPLGRARDGALGLGGHLRAPREGPFEASAGQALPPLRDQALGRRRVLHRHRDDVRGPWGRGCLGLDAGGRLLGLWEGPGAFGRWVTGRIAGQWCVAGPLRLLRRGRARGVPAMARGRGCKSQGGASSRAGQSFALGGWGWGAVGGTPPHSPPLPPTPQVGSGGRGSRGQKGEGGRLSLKGVGGGVQGGMGGLWGGGGGGGDPELLEAPKAPKKFLGLNGFVLKAPEKMFDWSKARRKFWPNHLRRGGAGGGGRSGGGGGLPHPPPHPPPMRC